MLHVHKGIAKVFLLLIPFLLIPTLSLGHVKWFAQAQAIKAPLEEIITPVFIMIALLIAVILGILPQLSPLVMEWRISKSINQWLAARNRFTPFILRFGVAVALILQMLYDSILAPEILLTETTLIIGAITTLLLLIPFRIFWKIGAIGILILFILAVQTMGWFHMLDYGFYLAIVAALILQNTKYEALGTPALYLGTGLSLCWVAVEKWVFPGLSLNILQEHGIPTFGFAPDLFVVISAFIEFVVGYLLVVGILNRLLALVVTLLFVMTTTVFGGVEVSGHFIVHIILIIFLIEGTGFYAPPIQMHERKIDQIIFVVLNFLFVLSTFILIYYRFA